MGRDARAAVPPAASRRRPAGRGPGASRPRTAATSLHLAGELCANRAACVGPSRHQTTRAPSVLTTSRPRRTPTLPAMGRPAQPHQRRQHGDSEDVVAYGVEERAWFTPPPEPAGWPSRRASPTARPAAVEDGETDPMLDPDHSMNATASATRETRDPSLGDDPRYGPVLPPAAVRSTRPRRSERQGTIVPAVLQAANVLLRSARRTARVGSANLGGQRYEQTAAGARRAGGRGRDHRNLRPLLPLRPPGSIPSGHAAICEAPQVESSSGRARRRGARAAPRSSPSAEVGLAPYEPCWRTKRTALRRPGTCGLGSD